MDSKLLKIGFQSPSLALEEEMTLDHALALIADHAPDLEEADEAMNLLAGIMDAGRYDGSDWSVWFVKRQPTKH